MTSYRLQDNPRIHAIGICERKNCGARFYKTEDIRQKYCSKSCAKAAQRHRRDARNPLPLVQKASKMAYAGRFDRFDLAATKQLQDVVSHREYASMTKPPRAHIDFEVTDGYRYFINQIFAPNVEFVEYDFDLNSSTDSLQPEELLIEAWVWQKELEKIMLEAPSILKEIENTIRTLRARLAEKHDIRFSQIDEFMTQYKAANKASG